MKKKTALFCALVMISLIPAAFAANQTNNTTGQVNGQDQQNTAEHKYQHANKNCTNSSTCTCDKEQNKYQYGQINTNKSTVTNKVAKKYQFGQKNDNKSTNCVDHPNCKKS